MPCPICTSDLCLSYRLRVLSDVSSVLTESTSKKMSIELNFIEPLSRCLIQAQSSVHLAVSIPASDCNREFTVRPLKDLS